MPADSWVTRENVALLTDAYELTMLQAYWRERMFGHAVFSLYVRRLPPNRNYLLACGLDDVLRIIEPFRFGPEAIEHLRSLGQFEPAFLEWLADLRFTGTIRAVPDGTPVFKEEPLLEVEAPLPEAQILETLVMNQLHFQTLVASRASRIVTAAQGRPVVEFGLRRLHGVDAGIKAARACYVAGVNGTSNVLAGWIYGIPTSGTMAHSYVQAHDSEIDAFRAFARSYPDGILLVDTYDTPNGVRNVIRLARELGEAFRIRAIRLDSGDLDALSRQARALLDEAGLQNVRIFASGGLDENIIARLVNAGAPIDAFGVGAQMGASADAPTLDMAYKLVEYDGRARTKLAPGKRILPWRKQVFRIEQDGIAMRDVIARADETLPGRPLLVTVMANGQRTAQGMTTLEAARERAREEVARLPARVRELAPADPPYEVQLSTELEIAWQQLSRDPGVAARDVSGIAR